MKKILFLLVFDVFFMSTISLAQTKTHQYTSANDFAYEENFAVAIPLYQSLLMKEPHNSKYNYKLGFCYLNTYTDKHKAIQYLKNAIEFNSENSEENKAPNDASFLLGQAYRLNNQFAEAITVFNNLLSNVVYDIANSNKIKREIQICKNGLELIKSPVNISITNLGENINSKFNDHCPILSNDETKMFFTSRRPELLTTGDAANRTSENIYISHKTNNVWSLPKSISKSINTEDHEAVCSLSADGKQLYFHKNGDIYSTSFVDNEWLTPKKLMPPINTEANETHASISSDGKYLFFTSDRSYGFGGMDIYVSTQLPNGQWGRARNMGSKINTAYNEACPFIHTNNKTLYFSSEGHNGLGGFDIFYSMMNENEDWEKSQNIGYPINTYMNDMYFRLNKNGIKAYYSTLRHDTKGKSDLYRIDFHKTTTKEHTIVDGVVASTNGEILRNAKIIVLNSDNQDTIAKYNVNPDNGTYSFKLDLNKNYNIIYLSDGYFPHNEYISVIEVHYFKKISKEIILAPADEKSNKTYELSFIDENDYIINTEAGITLNNISEFLRTNNQFIVDITNSLQTKTDVVLQKRIKAIKNILISKGIGKERILTDIISDIGTKKIELTLLDTIGKKLNERISVVDGNVTTVDGKIPKKAKISITNISDGKLYAEYKAKPENGNFKCTLDIDKNYNLLFEAEGYLPHHINLSVITLNAYNRITLPVILSPYKSNNTSVTYKVKFPDQEESLNSEAKILLSSLSDFLKENKNLYVDISGSRKYYKRILTKERTMSLTNHLTQNGISRDRIFSDLSEDMLIGDTLTLTLLDKQSKDKKLVIREQLEKELRPITISPSQIGSTWQTFKIGFNVNQDTAINKRTDLVLDIISDFLKNNNELFIDVTHSQKVEYFELANERIMNVINSILKKGITRKRISLALSNNEIEKDTVELTIMDSYTKEIAENKKSTDNMHLHPITILPYVIGNTNQNFKVGFDAAKNSSLNEKTTLILAILNDFMKNNDELFVDITHAPFGDNNDIAGQRVVNVIDALTQNGITNKRISFDLSLSKLEGDTIQLTILDNFTHEIAQKEKDKQIFENQNQTIASTDKSKKRGDRFLKFLNKNKENLTASVISKPISKPISKQDTAILKVVKDNEIDDNQEFKIVPYKIGNTYQTFKLAFNEVNSVSINDVNKLILSVLAKFMTNNKELLVDIANAPSIENESLYGDRTMKVINSFIHAGITRKRISYALSDEIVRGDTILITLLDEYTKQNLLNSKQAISRDSIKPKSIDQDDKSDLKNNEEEELNENNLIYSILLITSKTKLESSIFKNIQGEIKENNLTDGSFQYHYGEFKEIYDAEQELERLKKRFPRAMVFIKD